MMTHPALTSPGSFCWNRDCPAYAQLDQGNIRRFGKTRNGVQRFQCTVCSHTFTETKGTLFYGCKTPQEKILACLAALAERSSLRGIHRTLGVKEETVVAWLKKAAVHVETLEALLFAHYRLTRAQMDALWCYVFHKGEKGGTPRRSTAAPSGAG